MLKPAKEIFEEFLPGHEQVVELPAGDRVLIGDFVRQRTQWTPVPDLVQGVVFDDRIPPTP